MKVDCNRFWVGDGDRFIQEGRELRLAVRRLVLLKVDGIIHERVEAEFR